MNTFSIRLDLDKAPDVPEWVTIRQADKNGTTIAATIYDHGTQLAGSYDARVAFRLPDGEHYYRKAAAFSSGVATVTIDEQEAAAIIGTTTGYFEILSGSTVIASTADFCIRILRSAIDGAEPGETYDNAIQDAIDGLNDAVEALPTTVEGILEDHPEWTTTVQDGSITKAKFEAGAVAVTPNLIVGRLERGSISTNGADNNGTASKKNRCRTKGFIEFDEECRLWVKVKSGYKFAFLTYQADGTLVSDEYWYSATAHQEFGFVNYAGRKVRLCIAYADDAEITDLYEFEQAVTLERYPLVRTNLSDKTFTYGSIRQNREDWPYDTYPYICKTNGFLTFRFGQIQVEIMPGYSARFYVYTDASTQESRTDIIYAGTHVLNVDTTKLYRVNLGRDGSTDALAPKEACDAIRIVDGAGAITPWTEEDERLRQQGRYTSNGNNSAQHPFTLIHFSDIHGDATRLSRVVRYRSERFVTADEIICTGDLVNQQWSDDFGYWATAGASNVLIALGNHDEIVDRTNWDTLANYKTMAECYVRYLAPYISGWGVTSTENKTYYYKDYSYVRLIVLDVVQDYLSNDADQMAWFESTLAAAKTAGKAVVVAEHYPPQNRTALAGAGAWYDSTYSYVNPDRWLLRAAWQAAVASFVSSGGEFVCWLCGHTHADLVSVNSSYPTQVFLCVDTANPDKASPYSDTGRLASDDSPTQDLFNVISIDMLNKTLRVMRVGASENMYLQRKKTLCINYASATVVGVG